jgi:hypothetical protein
MLDKLLRLLGSNVGGDDNEEEVPQYKEDPATTALKTATSNKAQDLINIPYEDLVKRFSMSDSTKGFLDDVTSRYKGLIDTQDYSMSNYDQIEKDYLDSTINQYTKAREKAYQPIQESLIAENLMGSGPGYGIQSDFASDTAEGVGDISKKWAYEGIQRKQTQQQYLDALKRGDYTSMYNLALNKAQQEIAPQTLATDAEAGYLNSASGLFGQLQGADMDLYNSQMASYNARAEAAAKNKKNLGGLGVGLGLLASLAMPGAPTLLGLAAGGGIGGGLGSMFEY